MPSNNQPTNPRLVTVGQFRIWPPSRQRKWLTEMNREKAAGRLSAQHLQTLAAAQADFDRGL